MIRDLNPVVISTSEEKKIWQEPTLTVINQNNVGSGPVGTSIEGALTGGGAGPLSYHS